MATLTLSQTPAVTSSLNQNTGYGSTQPLLTQFGTSIPADANPSYRLTKEVDLANGAIPTSVYDSYQWQGIFGYMGPYIGSNVRAALNTPLIMPKETFSTHVGQVYDINVGVDWALGEKQATFGTQEYFLNQAHQSIVVPPNVQSSVNRIMDQGFIGVVGRANAGANLTQYALDTGQYNPDWLPAGIGAKTISVGDYGRTTTSYNTFSAPNYYAMAVANNNISSPFGGGGTYTSLSYANPRLAGSDTAFGSNQYTDSGIPYTYQNHTPLESYVGDASGNFSSARYSLKSSYTAPTPLSVHNAADNNSPGWAYIQQANATGGGPTYYTSHPQTSYPGFTVTSGWH